MQLFLTLLRIIGILILAVILLVLLVVLLVLLCPVRYRAIVTRELEKNPEVTARVTWLLHFLSVRVDYKEKLSYCVKILGFTLLKAEDVLAPKDTTSDEAAGESGSKADTETENADDSQSGRGSGAQPETEEKPAAKEQAETQGKQQAEVKSPIDVKPNIEKTSDIKEQSDTEKESGVETLTESEATSQSNHKQEEKNSQNENENQKVPFSEKINNSIQFIAGLLNELHGTIPEKIAEFLEKIAGFIEKISEYPDRFWEKIDALQKKKDRLLKQINDEQNRLAVKAVFGTTGSLLMHIKPQKLKIEGRLGFDDPAMTGQVFGLIGMLMPLYGETIHLEAVFHEAVAEGKLEAKGRIRIGTALYMVLKLISNKDVRRLIAQMKRLKKA